MFIAASRHRQPAISPPLILALAPLTISMAAGIPVAFGLAMIGTGFDPQAP